MMKYIATMLWFIMCIGFTIDTGHFVYLSLSHTLIGGAMVLLLTGLSLVHCLKHKQHILCDNFQVFVLLWVFYLALHGALTQRVEIYKLVYMEETLLLLLVLPYLVSSNLLSKVMVENGILLMNVICLIALILQALGLMDSYNQFFGLTGFSENPNVTAILLAVSLPFLYKRAKSASHRWLYALVVVLSVLFIIALKCRTAYIGLASMLIVWIFRSKGIRRSISVMSRQAKILSSIFFLAGILLAGMILYRSKQASSDGRLLIWKVTAMMIRENPQGIGIGMFEHDYNLRQGDYFASGESSQLERYNSNTVFMAYNDYLEHMAETGVPGVFFLFAFYISLMARAYRNADIELLSLSVAFFLMSFVNFIYSSIQPWIVFVVYSSLSIPDSPRPMGGPPPVMCRISGSGVVAACLLLIPPHGAMLWSQILLCRYQQQVEQGDSIEIAQAERLAEPIGTSEAYHRFMCRLYMQHGEYGKALQSVQNAKQYTSDPDVFFSAFRCLDRMDRTEEGITYICSLRKMLPSNLTSRQILLDWYDYHSETEAAVGMAQEILAIPLKTTNQQTRSIREYANRYLRKNNYKDES